MIYTSYFANKKIPSSFKKVSIARITPEWADIDFEYKSLAPSSELLMKYKNNKINEKKYEKIYKEQLNKLDPIKIKNDLEGMVLLCYEAGDDFCHRHILSEWLKENNIDSTELDTSKFKIKIVDTYSEQLCKENKGMIFVFGDNLESYGKGGQAVIRDCDNAFGIPTKRKPSMNEDAFFSDQDDEEKIVLKKLRELYKEMLKGKIIVFPKNGLGTGLAKMNEKSPKIFMMMNDIIEKHFLKHLVKKEEKTLF